MTQQHPERPDQPGRPGDAQPSYGQAQPPHGEAPQYGQPGQPGQYGQAPQYGQYGQYPAPGTRYGTQPYGVGGQYGTVPEPARFRTLLTLTLVSAALWVLSALPGFFVLDELLGGVLGEIESQPGISPQEVEAVNAFVGTAGMIGMVISVLVGLGLYALVYFNLRGVKNWARILGIVFAILGVLSIFQGIGYLFSSNILVVLSGALTIAYVVVNIVWLVTAFRRDVADWFRQGRPVTA